MSDEIVSSSQTETVPEVFQDESLVEVREAFGLPPKVETKVEEDQDDGEKSINDKPPAKEEIKAEPKMMKVKHNKEEIEVDVSDDKIPEYVQKSLALDKERERKTELEKTLERVAKLDGVSVTDYLANLDKKEAEAVQKEQNAYNELRQDLREQAEDAGLDPDKVEQYLNNHPLMKEAQKAIQERDNSRVEREVQNRQQTVFSQWQELYKEFPDIIEDSEAFNRGENPNFYTESMQAMVNQGYKPLDAFKLAHMDKLQNQTKKQLEQKAIKDLQLGNRSKVETIDRGTQENQASEELQGAFSLFGIDPKRAQKYAK